MTKRKDFLQKKADQETAEARRKVKAGDKKGAAAHLKKRGLYEKNIATLDAQILNLEKNGAVYSKQEAAPVTDCNDDASGRHRVHVGERGNGECHARGEEHAGRAHEGH